MSDLRDVRAHSRGAIQRPRRRPPAGAASWVAKDDRFAARHLEERARTRTRTTCSISPTVSCAAGRCWTTSRSVVTTPPSWTRWALGARAIPDPIAAGNFCRRFDEEAIWRLMRVTNRRGLRTDPVASGPGYVAASDLAPPPARSDRSRAARLGGA